ncbi:hypothetical protein B0J17DRAFT_678302 [Rhizoctonia solani]|nr:hypothetical protein B0J17DRAFT_678302 [Rhizoctonia solani]
MSQCLEHVGSTDRMTRLIDQMHLLSNANFHLVVVLLASYFMRHNHNATKRAHVASASCQTILTWGSGVSFLAYFRLLLCMGLGQGSPVLVAPLVGLTNNGLLYNAYILSEGWSLGSA